MGARCRLGRDESLRLAGTLPTCLQSKQASVACGQVGIILTLFVLNFDLIYPNFDLIGPYLDHICLYTWTDKSIISHIFFHCWGQTLSDNV